MSAHISMVYTCPRCLEGMSSIEDIIKCPSCGLPLGKMSLEPYEAPYTLHEQHLKYNDGEQLVKTLQELPIDKANHMVNDALWILENIAGKNVRVDGIRLLMGMAIKIGEIAKAYEGFLEAGGKHHPSYFIKSKQQHQESKNESDRNTLVPDSERRQTRPAAPNGNLNSDAKEVPGTWDRSQ